MNNKIVEKDFCYNQCTYRNRYDGWCHYHDEDADQIDDCEYCKKHC